MISGARWRVTVRISLCPNILLLVSGVAIKKGQAKYDLCKGCGPNFPFHLPPHSIQTFQGCVEFLILYFLSLQCSEKCMFWRYQLVLKGQFSSGFNSEIIFKPHGHSLAVRNEINISCFQKLDNLFFFGLLRILQ